MQNNLYVVPQDIFEEYVTKNNLKRVPGLWMHSYHYVNEQGEVKASFESSSWNPHRIYKISNEGYANLETMDNIKTHFIC